MTSLNIVFSGDRVALIVRGKTSHTHDPGLLAQHADCVLSNGAPIGFFGEGNIGSSGNASSGIGGSSRWSANSSNSSGVGMTGAVYDFATLSRKRANYVNAATARGTGTVSTVLLVQVSAAEAAAFDKAWADMMASPGMFNIVGWNCATHASQAFIKAGILSAGIPGLDTPDNLYRQLCFEKAGKLEVAHGYVGFSPFGGGYMMTVDAP
ncbi:hypothetical protein [Azoarcus olearius]|uniref:Uncharacterized protein n=1 Tax=Azoarcus sp. (strain BH72) TaxID=418699 RepID=A1K8U7_AZOSB|nr:hypothetical protein [Azoarcus olearius]CAL95252.1 hypothetical protein predicted by Glimmer/Critica [Azoarcus olearius]